MRILKQRIDDDEGGLEARLRRTIRDEDTETRQHLAQRAGLRGLRRTIRDEDTETSNVIAGLEDTTATQKNDP